jgi:hypothetical protein
MLKRASHMSIPSKHSTIDNWKKKRKLGATWGKFTWQQWLDVLSKGFFSILASIYIVGFLVVTMRYTQIGLPPPLWSLKYLIAGFFPLLTLVLLWLAFLIMKKYRKVEKTIKGVLYYAKTFEIFLLTYFGLLIIGKYLSGDYTTTITLSFTNISGFVILGTFVVICGVILVLGLLKKRIPLYIDIAATFCFLLILVLVIYEGDYP